MEGVEREGASRRAMEEGAPMVGKESEREVGEEEVENKRRTREVANRKGAC